MSQGSPGPAIGEHTCWSVIRQRSWAWTRHGKDNSASTANRRKRIGSSQRRGRFGHPRFRDPPEVAVSKDVTEWARKDSNLRLAGYEPAVLTAELRARTTIA